MLESNQRAPLERPDPAIDASADGSLARNQGLNLDAAGALSSRGTPPAIRLGEELPVFCEKCGYSLHGLPQARCGQCTILQFHCPECGHHQPINTLRPAFQSMLGRLRAFALVMIVVIKLAFIGLLLFAWFGMGVEWSYEYNQLAYDRGEDGARNQQIAPYKAPHRQEVERTVAFGVFAVLFSAVARMLLLRWRRGWSVGMVIAALVIAAISLGAWAEWYGSTDDPFPFDRPFTNEFIKLLAFTAVVVIAGATLVWPLWSGLVTVFLPRRASKALLDWQRAMSAPHPPATHPAHALSE